MDGQGMFFELRYWVIWYFSYGHLLKSFKLCINACVAQACLDVVPKCRISWHNRFKSKVHNLPVFLVVSYFKRLFCLFTRLKLFERVVSNCWSSSKLDFDNAISCWGKLTQLWIWIIHCQSVIVWRLLCSCTLNNDFEPILLRLIDLTQLLIWWRFLLIIFRGRLWKRRCKLLPGSCFGNYMELTGLCQEKATACVRWVNLGPQSDHLRVRCP